MLETLTQINPLHIALIAAWVLPWKGVALWKAARLYHKWWFIALLVLNTLALLEIIYIFFIAPKHEKLWRKESEKEDVPEE